MATSQPAAQEEIHTRTGPPSRAFVGDYSTFSRTGVQGGSSKPKNVQSHSCKVGTGGVKLVENDARGPTSRHPRRPQSRQETRRPRSLGWDKEFRRPARTSRHVLVR